MDDTYLPLTGFADAITLHLACSWATMPAFEMEMVCCSMASWMLVLSISFILSNSSMQQIPLSASTSDPPSSVNSPVTGSLWHPAVRPTELDPLPVVYTQRSNFSVIHFKNCDLPSPGSPMSSTLISPRNLWPPFTTLCTPEKRATANASLMLSCP